MIGRLQLQPLLKTRADKVQRGAEFARIAKEPDNEAIQSQGGGRRCFRFLLPDVDSAAVAEFDPMFTLQLAVSGADGVGMQAEAAGQFAGAGEALSGGEIVAQDGKDDLGYELLPDGDVAAAREPELHAALS